MSSLYLFNYYLQFDRFKYPLAVTAKLLNTFGPNQGGGYDTGCQLESTIQRSTLGPLARSLNYTSLVDAFHGHAHRRLCQLDHLATYQLGLGIEDLGMCERAFSGSNAMGGVTRGMSVFHRQQEIDHYFRYTDDMETYQNLSKSFSLPASMTVRLCYNDRYLYLQ